MKQSLKPLMSSESSDWLTPDHILDKIWIFWGDTDLDPCASLSDPTHTRAHVNYTIKDNGLRDWWHGKVFCNPPYGKELPIWINHALRCYGMSNNTQILLLIPARTDTLIIQSLLTWPTCFIKGRLKFSNSKNSAPFPSMLTYLGDRKHAFVDAFKDLGRIMWYVEGLS